MLVDSQKPYSGTMILYIHTYNSYMTLVLMAVITHVFVTQLIFVQNSLGLSHNLQWKWLLCNQTQALVVTDMEGTLKLFCVKPLPVCMTAGFISFLSNSYSPLFFTCELIAPGMHKLCSFPNIECALFILHIYIPMTHLFTC